MSAVILPFIAPRIRANPVQPHECIEGRVRAYCWKIGLGPVDRATVMRQVTHLQQCGINETEIAARTFAMANRLHLSHQPDPNGPEAA